MSTPTLENVTRILAPLPWSALRQVRKKHVVLDAGDDNSLTVQLFNRPWQRLQGCIGKDLPRPDCGALLLPCNGVHSHFMHQALDVVFVDETGCVLAIRCLRPGLWIRRADAFAVIELPAGQATHLGIRADQRLCWRPQAEVR